MSCQLRLHSSLHPYYDVAILNGCNDLNSEDCARLSDYRTCLLLTLSSSLARRTQQRWNQSVAEKCVGSLFFSKHELPRTRTIKRLLGRLVYAWTLVAFRMLSLFGRWKDPLSMASHWTWTWFCQKLGALVFYSHARTREENHGRQAIQHLFSSGRLQKLKNLKILFGKWPHSRTRCFFIL